MIKWSNGVQIDHVGQPVPPSDFSLEKIPVDDFRTGETDLDDDTEGDDG